LSSTPRSPFSLFEISWEVCNKVGGIHTVLVTKAATQVARFGDDYIAVGPWLLGENEREAPLDDEPGHEAFCEACRQMGLPVRVGRWRIPGRPRTLLIEFSSLYEHKDELLGELWEDYQVDSLQGDWDYVEPVTFGIAAGRVIERWWEEYLAPHHRRAVVQSHEWMTSASLLHLKRSLPSVGTVFTTHATMLGRALASLGQSPEHGLGERTPEELAEENGVVAKHSLEGIAAREADVFTTVSTITAAEAELLHRRAPEPVLPNGIDVDVLSALAGDTDRGEARARLVRLGEVFLGEPLVDAALVAISGRYEFHNKGIDVTLDALARMQTSAGRTLVLFVLVPAGNSGLRSEVLERLENGGDGADGPLGLSTHHLFDAEHDPVQERCRELGLDNAPGSRVKVIQIPVYLDGADGLLDLPYEAVLRGMDLSCFPSYYEPWGYTPQESLAVGVPTITTDYAGFGRWAREKGLDEKDGVTVVPRVGCMHEEVVEGTRAALEQCIANATDAGELASACQRAAQRTAWKDLIANYEHAWDAAITAVQDRCSAGAVQRRKPRRPLEVSHGEGGGPRLLRFDVTATLPYELRALARLARNLWWCWDAEATRLFAELSPQGWAAAEKNPVAFLRRAYPADLAARAEDADYLARLERVEQRFDAYLAQPADERENGPSASNPVAYFSAEFGLHESLRIYSGGLGILAGDHLKSASDTCLPLIGVGLFYRKGYLEQRLSVEGEQLVGEIDNEPGELPVTPVLDETGAPLEIELALPGRHLALRAWRVDVGRVPLYLLDADVERNRAEDRKLSSHLYGGDSEMRIQQEILLGRGGVRLLRRMGVEPSVWHMNEGHAAFMAIERVRRLVGEEGLSFEAAREQVRGGTAFTTHTPVPAGHDRFGEDLVRRYFSDAAEWVGLPWERFYALGQAPGEPSDSDFNMTYLALGFAGAVNGVAKLHGIASRELLHCWYPALLQSEVPISTITNGVHLATWTDPALARELGAKDETLRPAHFESGANKLEPARLWTLRQEAKTRLFESVRANLERTFVERDDSPVLLRRMLDGLQEDALTIGFARRFAPYKRAHLLFQDLERLRALLDSEERPLRVLIAGKAHPRDQRGKDILQEVVRASRSDELAGRVYFLEGYDVDLARHLVQGVDVWLNNPIRMKEASGTSGMKSSANGGLNLSIGDGWWPEAADGKNGWTIAEGRVYEEQALQDQLDSATLYRLLEEEVVPLFFERDADGLPQGWIERARHALASIPTQFNTDRMVEEYAARAYRPLARRGAALAQRRHAGARALAEDNERLRKGFQKLEVASVSVGDLAELRVGEPLEVTAQLRLGALSPDDVVVELLLGNARGEEDLEGARVLALAHASEADGLHSFEVAAPLERSGGYAWGVRVRPRRASEPGDSLAGLAIWA